MREIQEERTVTILPDKIDTQFGQIKCYLWIIVFSRLLLKFFAGANDTFAVVAHHIESLHICPQMPLAESGGCITTRI